MGSALHVATDRDAWLAERRKGIGGSEIAALVGCHPFLSPWDVWLSKVEGYERPESPLMEQGRYLEPGVADWYAARQKVELRELGNVVHPYRPLLRCTPDRIANHPDGNSRLLSIKVPGPWFDAEEWGDRYSWRVPTYAWLQIQHEMYVCGPNGLGLVADDWAHLAAPLGGDLQILTVQGDTAVQGKLAAMAEEWWGRHVDGKEPPPLDGSAGAKMYLRRKFPESPHPIRDATPAEDVAMLALKGAEEALADAERNYSEKRQVVEEAIGPAEGLRSPAGRVTFRANKKGTRTLLTNWRGP